MTEEQKHSIEATVARESPGLLGFIRKSIPDLDEARDILQDTFYQLVVSYDTIEDLDRITSWLYAVARNKIIDNKRKKKPDYDLDGPINKDDQNPLFLSDILPSWEPGPDEELMNTILWEALEEAISALPDKQKEVFIMHEFEDRSFSDIAAVTGIKLNTLLTRKRQAVLYLRSRLQELFNQLIT